MKRPFHLVFKLFLGLVVFAVSGLAWAAPTEAPGVEAKDPTVLVPTDPDPLGRDKDSMMMDADAGARPGFVDQGMQTRNDQALMQGSSPHGLPSGFFLDETFEDNASVGIQTDLHHGSEHQPFSAHGFVHAAVPFFFPYNEPWQTNLLLREIEVDLASGIGDAAKVQIDLNLYSDWPSRRNLAYSSDLTTTDLMDAIIEQAFVQSPWHDVVLWAGRVNVPFGVEAQDPIDRTSLSRSWVLKRAMPQSLTGFQATWEIHKQLGLRLFAADPWYPVASKWARIAKKPVAMFGAGIPHRFFAQTNQAWAYEGMLTSLFTLNMYSMSLKQTWLVDYTGHVTGFSASKLSFQMIYGREKSSGFNSEGFVDGSESAKWWGGVLVWDAFGANATKKFDVGIRIEYLHDHDLILHLPHLPRMTTLFGTTFTLRRQIATNMEWGVEYRTDFECGNVENVSVQGESGWNVLDWYKTQLVQLVVIGKF